MEWLPAQRYRYDGRAVAGVSACMAVDDVSMVIIRQTREHIQQDGGLGAAGALVNGMGWFLMFAFAETDWGAVAASVHLTAAVGCSKWENASRPRVLAPAETASNAGKKMFAFVENRVSAAKTCHRFTTNWNCKTCWRRMSDGG
jgi:hypothetical protein